MSLPAVGHSEGWVRNEAAGKILLVPSRAMACGLIDELLGQGVHVVIACRICVNPGQQGQNSWLLASGTELAKTLAAFVHLLH